MVLSKADNSSAVIRVRRKDELYSYDQQLLTLTLLLNAGSPLCPSLLQLYLSHFDADCNGYSWIVGPV